MSWHNKLTKQGIKVRGEVDTSRNCFPYDKDESTDNKKAYYDWDCYIICRGLKDGNVKGKIMCSTSDVKYCRKHVLTFYAVTYGTGMNILRKYYITNIGTKEDIHVPSSNNPDKDEWKDTKMINRIRKEGVLFDIIGGKDFSEVEFSFYEESLPLIESVLRLDKRTGKDGKLKKSRSPFDDKYLEWSNEYKIASKDLKEYNKVMLDRFGKGVNVKKGQLSRTATSLTRKEYEEMVVKKDKSRKDDKDIYISDKRRSKISEDKVFLHSVGMWDRYMHHLTNSTV